MSGRVCINVNVGASAFRCVLVSEILVYIVVCLFFIFLVLVMSVFNFFWVLLKFFISLFRFVFICFVLKYVVLFVFDFALMMVSMR